MDRLFRFLNYWHDHKNRIVDLVATKYGETTIKYTGPFSVMDTMRETLRNLGYKVEIYG